MEMERYDHGTIAYVALRGGEWSRSEFPHEQVTLDFDSQSRLIGIEMLVTKACSGTNPDNRLKLG